MRHPTHILATLALSAALTAGLGLTSATLASAHALPWQHDRVATNYETASHGLILNVTNKQHP